MHDINHKSDLGIRMDWQSGYGVVSFGAKDLSWVIDYLRNQKRHHQDKSVFDRLERIDQDETDG